ncbi:M48 family metalloprotease [Thermococcus thioreducens]|uniref:Heat shock protein HtpX n=1 Tax=Thermococcus thioreducens TaxID=277988 RepID=A0A0Q2QSP6_9EURY|nr:M48 family metalloprotease [Thermococcus thioreducens]ASJ12322.1 protease [Thermococcus thioreducens]KQH83053.1 protease [Thermococcus thioreducens]SEV92849.1 heat shock protein HtpX [Thermococcus thioreducens]
MRAIKWLRLVLVILLAALVPAILGYLLGGIFGLIAVLFLIIIVDWLIYWYGDRFLMKWYRARPVAESDYPYLYAVLRKLSSSAGIPVPKLALAPIGTPNLFSTGRGSGSTTIVLTYGLLRALDSEEIEGVLAHEIAHIMNGDIAIQTVVSMISGFILSVAYALGRLFSFAFQGGKGEDPNDSFLVGVLAPVAGGFLHIGLSPSREYLADEHGARISGKPLALASALLKLDKAISFRPMKGGNLATSGLFIVNPFRGNLARMVSTHPPTDERAERLLKMAEEMGVFT